MEMLNKIPSQLTRVKSARINRIELGLCLHWSIFLAGRNHIAVRLLSSAAPRPAIIIDCGEPWHLRLGTAESFRFGYNRPMNVMNGRAHRENTP